MAKRSRIPHVFILLLSLILLCSLLTWIIPSGSYRRETKEVGGFSRTLVAPGSYAPAAKALSARALFQAEAPPGEAAPVGLVGFLSAVPKGMARSADIIFFIFIIGGTLGILQRTGAVHAAMEALLRRSGISPAVLTAMLVCLLAAGGSTLGMGEEYIPLVPFFLLFSRRIGHDRVYGVAMVLLGAHVGFAAATTNPFSLNVAQGIAELPLNSGLGLRLPFFVLAVALAILHLLRYGRRIRTDPSRSLAPWNVEEADPGAEASGSFRRSHGIILLACGLLFAGILVCVQLLGWWMAEMAGGFLLMGVLVAALDRRHPHDAASAFVKGAQDMVVPALVVGFARGIQVVLEDGMILDTIIHGASELLRGVAPVLAAEGMLVLQAVLNFFIPSGSGQAAVTMPIMAPLADLLGITRQTAVFAFQCGDGFSNSLIPTSGVLMAMLGIARVPWEKWLRFVFPLFLQLMALSALFLAAAVWIGYS